METSFTDGSRPILFRNKWTKEVDPFVEAGFHFFDTLRSNILGEITEVTQKIKVEQFE